jgi:molybdopterin synthase sulfur carrier subunit
LMGPLLQCTGNKKEVDAKGSTLGEALDSLGRKYPGLGDSIRDEQGKVREFINLFVGGREMRDLQGERTRLKDGDTVYVIPSVAGGVA